MNTYRGGWGLAPRFLKHIKAELNPICHLLVLLRAHHILHVSRLRVKLGTKWMSGWSYGGPEISISLNPIRSTGWQVICNRHQREEGCLDA